MNDFDSILELQLKHLLDPVVASVPGRRGNPRGSPYVAALNGASWWSMCRVADRAGFGPLTPSGKDGSVLDTLTGAASGLDQETRVAAGRSPAAGAMRALVLGNPRGSFRQICVG